MSKWFIWFLLITLAESSAGSLGFIDRQERRGERHSVSDQRLETLRALVENIDQIVNSNLKAKPDLTVEDLFSEIRPLLDDADLDVLISTYVFHPSTYARSSEVGLIAIAGAGFVVLRDRAIDHQYPYAKESRIALRRMRAELEVLAAENKNGARGEYFEKLEDLISDLELFNKASK